MCRTTNLIFAQKAKLDLTNESIARDMIKHGVQISGEAVQKYFSGGSGIPLDNLGAFLRVLGVKVVLSDTPDITSAELNALKMFAGKYLTSNEDAD